MRRYKGYSIQYKNGCYYIVDKNGEICRMGIAAYLKSEREVIDRFIKHQEQQPPKKRLETEIEYGELVVYIKCFCPDCNWELGRLSDKYKYETCANCGQIIDWSGV